jgi:hypothetical protein
MTTDHLLNISQAAKATGKSIPTIRLALANGKLPNARSIPKGKNQSWLIPLTDLVASGLLDQVNPSSALSEPASDYLELRVEVAALRAENAQLLARLADLERARADLIAAYAPRIETAEVQATRKRFWFSR